MAINDFLPDKLQLIAAAKEGNAEAFGRLYDGHIKPIYDFIFYKTLDKETAEDITSTVFMKAWKNISQCHPESFAAWLYTIARRAVTDFYRQKKDNIDIDDCWDLADSADMFTKIEANLQFEAVRAELKKLRNQEREIIIMRFWLGLSFQEIAVYLDKSEGAVKMSLSRALKDIRARLPLALIIMLPLIIQIYEGR